VSNAKLEARDEAFPLGLDAVEKALEARFAAQPLEYEPRFERLNVNAGGDVYWRNRRIFIAESFANETIALEPIDYTRWRVHYGKFVVGILDEQAHSFI
jgi:hypothetical protein